MFSSGSDETESYTPREAALVSEQIAARGLTVLDVIRALAVRGFRAEAENLLFILKLRLSGDYLQTSACVRDGRVLSAVNDPNDYTGPGSGYRMAEARRQEINAIRDVLDRETVLANAAAAGRGLPPVFRPDGLGMATPGADTREVVIGVSPAFGSHLFTTLAGHPLGAVLAALREGIASRGLTARVVRMRHTADTSFLGLSAAHLAGSGVGIGIQAKGTAVIHQRGRLPHNNLELFSNAPLVTLAHYRAMGANAAAHALGELPEPVVVPTYGQALGARYHAQVALIYAVETAMTTPDAEPEELDVVEVAA